MFVLSIVANILSAVDFPPIYESRSLVSLIVWRPGDPTYDPAPTEWRYSLLRTPKILNPVIKELSLDKRWSHWNVGLDDDETLGRLQGEVHTRHFPAKEANDGIQRIIIEIAVCDTNRQLAADISNSIAREFRDERQTTLRNQMEKGLAKLREELTEQEHRESRAKQRLEQVRADLSKSVVGGTNFLVALAVTEKELEQEAATYTQLKNRIDQEEADLKSPHSPPVEIVQLATPANLPVGFRKGLGVGTATGLLSSVAWYLLSIRTRRQATSC